MRRLAALVLILGSCAGPSAAPAPPEIVYGRDICVQCGMILSDPRFAAAYRVEGEARIFDDIGDMVVYGLEAGELTGDTPAWVHDYYSGNWIEADAAWFVHDAELITPMDHGLVAFEDRAAADALAGFGGQVLTWDNLLTTTIRDTVLDFDERY